MSVATAPSRRGIELAEKDQYPPTKDKSGPVPKEALEFFRRKGLKPSFSYTDVWQQEHNLAFTVAKIAERDILSGVRDTIDKALADGTPFEEWQKQALPLLKQSGWADHVSEDAEPSRLRTIYDTNMRMARANGQEDRAQKTKEVLPFFVYELGPSKVHNPDHVAWEGLIFEVDDPFWDLHAPPSKWGCKCRRRQITQGEADDAGGESEAPDEEMVPFELPDGRTGEAPTGVDPAFAYPKTTAGRQRALDDALDSSK